MFTFLKNNVQNFFIQHRHLIVPVSVVGGFFIHIITMSKIDRWFENAVLIAYIFLVTITTLLLFSREAPVGNRLNIKNHEGILTMVMLYGFGGLFSGFVIFYTKSGSLISGWPFVVIMLALMLGTEFLKGYYKRLTFQFVLYFIVVFAHLIFFIPLLANDLGTIWFLISGGISIIWITLFFVLARHINKPRFIRTRKKLFISISIVFAVFNALYFTNIIPPIPLSLEFKAVYHNVTKITEGQYRAVYEKNPWYSLRKRSHIIHISKFEPVYVFTSVYAPIDFTTSIMHQWQYFDENSRRWVTTDSIVLPLAGGRDEGFRGFSKKGNTFPGSWRIIVRTKRQQILGYVYFRITDEVPQKYNFITENL